MNRRKATRNDLPETVATEVISGYTLETLSNGRCKVYNHRMFYLASYQSTKEARTTVKRVVRKYDIQRTRRQLNFHD
jgi:hypothetical protein